jgi:hypothetical protein
MHVFSLTDNSTTISLSASNVIVLRYDLQPPNLRDVEAHFGGDGSELTRPAWMNVTESIEILISGASVQAVRDKGNDIERLIGKARDNRRILSLERVYIQAQVSGETDVWRSEILSARLVWQDALDGIPKLAARASIIITRRYYWEGPEVALPLASAVDSTATTPVRLYNDHDNSSNNYFAVGVSNSALAGQLPAPFRLHLVQAEASTVSVRDIYITNMAFVGTVSPFRRGTQNDLAHGATYTTANSTNAVAYRWTLSDSVIAAYAGRYARILVAFDATFDGYMQSGALLNAGGAVGEIYRNSQVRGGAEGGRLLDTGSVPIPPGRDMPSPTGTAIGLWVQKAGGITVNLRYIQMTPAGEGVFRRLYSWGGIPAAWTIVDDGISNTTYAVDTGGKSTPSVHGYHSPLMVFPGRTNRFRVLYHTATGLGAGNELTAQAWIRPRRLTV